MDRRRRTALLIVAVVVLCLLVAAPLASASAGGGSSAFGGGGGGGHGGRGAALYLLFQILIRVALFGHGLGALIIVAVIIAFAAYSYFAPRTRAAFADHAAQGRSARRRSQQRERRTEAAAAEAAEEDPAFAPDVVKPQAAALFSAIQHAWDQRDRAALGRLVAPGLLAEWERRLDDFDRKGWHNRVEPVGSPTVTYVGLSNRGAPRVTVRIEAKLRDYVETADGRHVKRFGRVSDTVSIREFWTLARSAEDRWILASIERGAEGAHALSENLVATPWSDEQALRDEALTEQAMADAAPDDVSPAELISIDLDGDARAQALDLSLADGRFAPAVLEVAARRAVHAWTLAVDGDTAELRTLATTDAIDQLLHPTPGTRLVVRGARVTGVSITRLDAAAHPPAMTIAVNVEGRRYVEDRDTAAVLSGSPNRVTRFTELWTLTLDGDAAQPWRIARVSPPAVRA